MLHVLFSGVYLVTVCISASAMNRMTHCNIIITLYYIMITYVVGAILLYIVLLLCDKYFRTVKVTKSGYERTLLSLCEYLMIVRRHTEKDGSPLSLSSRSYIQKKKEVFKVPTRSIAQSIITPSTPLPKTRPSSVSRTPSLSSL